MCVCLIQRKAEYIKKATKLLSDKYKGDIPPTLDGIVSIIDISCIVSIIDISYIVNIIDISCIVSIIDILFIFLMICCVL